MTDYASSREKQWYWETIISISTEIYDLVSHYLFESGADGVEELEESREKLTLKIYFPARIASPSQIIEDVFNQIRRRSKYSETHSIKKMPFQNWRDNWKDHFKPLSVGRSFLVRPPWEKPRPDKREIVIYPGLGFGTGYHESTCLALEALEWLSEKFKFKKVVDVGTGSGILTIAALLLEAEQATAIDIDREALAEVPKNLALSGIDPARCSVLFKEPKELDAAAGLVIANIEYSILKDLIEDLTRLTQKDGYLILSGQLTSQKEALLRKLPESMSVVKESRLNEWSVFVAFKTVG